MIWTDPSLLGLGAALTALVLLGLWSHAARRRRLAEFMGGRRATARLARPDLHRLGLHRLLLLGAAGLALSLAAAEPRWVSAPEPQPPVKRIVLAIDVSASMQAEDAAPTRLGRAVQVAHELLDSLEHQRVGLLLFAGTTYALAPPTLDHAALRFLLGGVTPRIASAQDPGTLLSVAIENSVALLRGELSPGADSLGLPQEVVADAGGDPSVEGEQLVILISDGDAGEPSDRIAAAVAVMDDAGIRMHVVGIGTADGAGMTMPGGTYQLGGAVLDASGRPATSRLGEGLLREVARAGRGRYASADLEADLRAVRADLADPGPDLSGGADGSAPAWARHDLPFVLGAFALVLVLLESLLGMTSPRLRSVRAPEAA